LNKKTKKTRDAKGVILFSGVDLYLTLPQYYAFVHELKDFHNILLFLYDPFKVEYDKPYKDRETFLKHFDSFLDLTPLDNIPKKGSQRYYYKFKKILNAYLNKINPIAIISCSDMLFTDHLLFYWCKKKNRPFIIMQPCFLDITIPRNHDIFYKVKYIIFNKLLRIPKYRKQDLHYGDESHKNYLFLWSNYFLESSERKNVIFTGNPVFDSVFKNFKPTRNIKKNILICTQPLDELFNQNVDDLHEIYLKAIKRNPNFTFYIKIHPRENLHKYDEIYNKNDYPNIKIVRDTNLYELFKISDVQISTASFTTFEAAAFGIPVITVNPNNRFKFLDHYRGEINLHITKSGELTKAIERTLTDEYWEDFKRKREKYFKKILYSTDGQSAKRVAKIVQEIIKEKKIS